MNDQELETRLRARYRIRAVESASAPLSLRRDVAAITQTATLQRRRLSRGITLLAAAALLLVGGALVVGIGAQRQLSVNPPAASTSLPAAAIGSPVTTARSSASSGPSVTCAPLRVWAINLGGGGGFGYSRISEPVRVSLGAAKEAVVGFGGGDGWSEPSIEAIGPDGETVVNDAPIQQVPPHVLLNQIGVWKVSVRDQMSGCLRDLAVTVRN